MFTVEEFYQWERASRDTIDLKRCYVDIAGDLVSGILLSQIIYWFLPGEKGQKLQVEKEGRFWLAKGRTDWWDECRITPKQFDRAIQVLKEGNLVETKRFRFFGSPTVHIWLNIETLLQGVNWILTKGEKPIIPKGEMQVDERVKTLTETTPETTSKTTIKKTSYGEFQNIALYDAEFNKLNERFGGAKTLNLIEQLSAGIQSKGYKYKSHYATILNWERRDQKGGKVGVDRKRTKQARSETPYSEFPEFKE